MNQTLLQKLDEKKKELIKNLINNRKMLKVFKR